MYANENDLAHGEWSKWCESIGMNDRVARMMMTVAASLPVNRRRRRIKALYVNWSTYSELVRKHVTSRDSKRATSHDKRMFQR